MGRSFQLFIQLFLRGQSKWEFFFSLQTRPVSKRLKTVAQDYSTQDMIFKKISKNKTVNSKP